MNSLFKSFTLPLTLAVSIIVSLVSAGLKAQVTPDHPDWIDALNAKGTPITVYTAKKIYTMDPGRPEASAVAVLDGKVLSTGTLETMQPWLSRYKYKIDNSLQNKIVFPGFIEPHSHFWISAGFLGLSYIGPIAAPNPRGGMYEPVMSGDAVVEKLKEYDRAEKDPNKPLVAYGFDPAQQGGELNREILDKVSKTRPITVIAFAPHFAYLNSAALKVLKETHGVDKTTDIHGIEKDKNGELTGVFVEVLAVTTAMAPVGAEVVASGGVKGLLFMSDIARSVGVTTTSEMTFGAIDFDQEWKDTKAAAADKENFSIRMRLVPLESALTKKYGDKKLDAYWKLRKNNDDQVFVDGIKFLADGSFPLMSSMLNYPGYLEGKNGSVNDIPWDKYTETMFPYWKAGIQIHAHSNGDLALDKTLETLAKMQEKHPRFDHRFTIEHYSMSNPMQARRLSKLGGQASVNIYFAHYRSQLHSDNGFGPDRSRAVGRLATLERERVPFALHSDYPQVIVPLNPMIAVWTAVNRIAEDGKTVVAPHERISVERAMRAITIDAAYILGMENKIGSLEPGKYADFAILEEDPYAVDKKNIKDIKVWGTALNGKLYKSER